MTNEWLITTSIGTQRRLTIMPSSERHHIVSFIREPDGHTIIQIITGKNPNVGKLKQMAADLWLSKHEHANARD